MPTIAATSSDGLTWTTAAYYPSGYSGNTYSDNFEVESDPAGSFPTSTIQSITVTASDNNNGADSATGTLNGTPDANQVPVGVDVTCPVHHSLGPDLNITIVIIYPVG